MNSDVHTIPRAPYQSEMHFFFFSLLAVSVYWIIFKYLTIQSYYWYSKIYMFLFFYASFSWCLFSSLFVFKALVAFVLRLRALAVEEARSHHDIGTPFNSLDIFDKTNGIPLQVGCIVNFFDKKCTCGPILLRKGIFDTFLLNGLTFWGD